MKLLVTVISVGAIFTGCAQAVVGTDPGTGITYSDQGAQADIHGDAERLAQVAQTVLQRAGLETSRAQSSSSTGVQNIDGRNGINGATVRIVPNASNTTHIEVIATEGTICWNMDYAGQILQDIVQSK